ncbi:metallophosphoesterase family protein [Serratia liquefaciens]|uniref:metallophosphoesterase family protein n=1 Tax=Serratia liquefaciens TaxID=614 RepID=UPI001F11FD8A|nr:metallophosphoesterase [Serratia liquefaciens]
MLDIIHLSDLHFGDPNAPFEENKIADSLSKYILDTTENPILLISGDVTIKGQENGYSVASTFFEKMISDGKLNRKNIISCPGNHDIVDNKFSDYDSFIYGLRRDHDMDFSEHSFRMINVEGITFLLLNSSYHLDHKYGLIDAEVFKVNMNEQKNTRKILVLHHHILNQFRDDTSAIRNAYDLVQFIEKNSFDMVLHGHQHSEQFYHLGECKVPVISARSGNFNQRGYINAFNHYTFSNEKFSVNSYAFEKNNHEINIISLSR